MAPVITMSHGGVRVKVCQCADNCKSMHALFRESNLCGACLLALTLGADLAMVGFKKPMVSAMLTTASSGK